MKAKKKKARHIRFTDRDARVFKALVDVWDGLEGDEALDYLEQAIDRKWLVRRYRRARW